MVFTQRDLYFLKDLTQVNFLNAKRIYRIYGVEGNCRLRLNLMIKDGFIEHSSCLSNREYVFSPTMKAYHMMDTKYKKKFPNDKINHYLAVADFYFYMKKQGVLDEFTIERQYYFNHNGKKYSFRPDIEIDNDGKLLLVEIDLSNRRFEKKLETWEAFYDSGLFKEHFEKFPPIIIVSTDIKKVENIINKNKKVDLNYVYKDYEEIKKW